ncbi:methylated-DNA--[protein]-cysteine S-methyltransferase [Stagnihabitans tardus]|uniref:Methylated-DNA--[protein]-cysteine S-methyltransferase n=1 Tax=Stagnihabitans tardus TaxID=2699202 RepID=A0AAE5BUU1_9RHOB|nr:methylated-DNA--[protein]-cysteine S-methyltransferase [Stagnihabitans tardus]NBZ88251.1 methylated-DNA--[protein]-cysteine S-methyltransferase [Stagnihabitans tardus]
MRQTLITPLGPISLSEEDGALTALHWREGTDSSPLITEALAQLQAYFAGRLMAFDLPLAFRPGLTGAVQRQMVQIPKGETRTYGQIARAVKAPAQAVGQACGANPLPILVPCHRVLGATTLGGFSAPGGVEAKVWLLRHEGGTLLL